MEVKFHIRNIQANIHKIITFLSNSSTIRGWKKHLTMIGTQIYYVSHGIKLGYLWDAGPQMNPVELRLLVCELVKVELIPETVKVLEFCTELFIVNHCEFDKLIQHNEMVNSLLIDVTKSLDKPVLIQQDMGRSKISNLLEFISHKTNLQQKLSYLNICGPTVIGLLIGYPVLYWYDAEISDENNLNNSRLKIFQLSHNNSIVYSFSVPNDLIHENHVLEKAITDWLDVKSRAGLTVETFVTEAEYVVM